MTGNGNGFPRSERRPIADAVAARRRSQMVTGLRGLASRPPSSLTQPGNGATAAPNGTEAKTDEHCDLCSTSIPVDHRHMLNIEERRIVCTCESCWALRSGDAEYRPVGSRTVWLPDLHMPDDVWAGFQIPIGLAFFFRSAASGGIVALYPSPAGATECLLDLDAWSELGERYPLLAAAEPEVEAILIRRTDSEVECYLVPVDICYELIGKMRLHWHGFDGGAEAKAHIEEFFGTVGRRALPLKTVAQKTGS